jgi:hypothetical protein
MTHSKELIALGVGGLILVLSCIVVTVILWKRIKRRLAAARPVFLKKKMADWDQPLMDSDEEDEVVIM